MQTRLASLFILAALMLIPRMTSAATPTCDSLEGEKKALATAILGDQHPYDCCDETIASCLQKKRVCRLARRLAEQVCRMVAAGKDRATIERSLARRAASMRSARPVSIDLGHAERAGEDSAKVTLVAYLCARCPYCARIAPRLHQAVTQGILKGKVKAYVREFPIRSHAHSTAGGKAMVAARRLGKGWTFLLHIYRIFNEFDPAKLPDCAAHHGMDRSRFVALMSDPDVRRELVDSKKEGVRNRVDGTPTLFINGRKYTGDLDYDTVVDTLLEEYDRKSGAIYE